MIYQSDNRITKTIFNGINAYELNVYPYQAIILPECGGNLIAFRDVENNYSFLREPADNQMDDFKENPFLYGIPVLFPPNRIENGRFSFLNHTYKFPINEPVNKNHLHGFFYNHCWEVSETTSSEMESTIELSLKIDKQSDIYRYFPHSFRMSLRYTLSENELVQNVTILNEGKESMPLMLGFHTSINAPFSKNSTMEDYNLQLSIKEKIELNERSLPTGKRLDLKSTEKKLSTEGNSPFFQQLDHHYAAQKDQPNRMVLTDKREKISLIYETGSKYPFWMLYNRDAKSGFFCPEPQTNMVNGPNVPIPLEQTGIIELKSGEFWSAHSRFYTIKHKLRNRRA
ncbi:aldose 1-epimerase [Bacillus sp. FJAT-27251]|uniref:aldose 1-epimerase n=1 Tax=Bacillus sp. FJAT-27251 TaxID=1684142 RepID=UPI0006A7BF98|nr:aldose 1-epimerase [Bacillus sp. FJAT-27251]